MMHAPSSRYGVLAAPIVAAGCGRRSPYFGNATPPSRPALKFGRPEPEGLDPADYSGGFELYFLPSVFEGLVSCDPYTLEPMAAAGQYQLESL